jgi:hypothetical protein
MHYLVEAKEIVIGGATYGIMYSCLPTVIMTL